MTGSGGKELGIIILALASGGTYFFVADLGSASLKPLLENCNIHMDDNAFKILAYFLSAGASACFTAFSYKAFSNLTLIPRHPLSIFLSALAPVASGSFFTACLLGSQSMGASAPVAVSLALTLYFTRTLTMIDGSVKFPDKAKELYHILFESVKNKDFTNLARLSLTLYTAVGFSMASTDNIFSAFNFLLNLCKVPEGAARDLPCYTLASLGAIGLFPMIMYWTYRGILQLTWGGKPDENGINLNPTDKYTWLAALATIPVIFGSLGSVTSVAGKMFGGLGHYGEPIKVTTSMLYSVGGAIPGLSTIFRAAGTCTPNFSSCKSAFFKCLPQIRRPDAELTPLIEKSGSSGIPMVCTKYNSTLISRLVHEIQESPSVPRSLDPADKPRDEGATEILEEQTTTYCEV